MATINIPRKFAAFVSFCDRILQGAIAIGEAIGLHHNPVAAIAAEFYALIGAAGAEGVTGTQSELDQALAAVSQANDNCRLALRRGRDHCSQAISLLSLSFGKSWSPAWQAVGFTDGSLAVPADPLSALKRMQAYFLANPDREAAALGITAAALGVTIGALETAQQAADAAKATVADERGSRDMAKAVLHKRVLGVIKELRLLLPPDDFRWYTFGLPRPIDGNIPLPLMGLTLTPDGPGQVLVSYDASSRATQYRVRMKVNGAEGDPVEVAFTAELQVTLRELTTGTTITVFVSAYNAAGETLPAQAEIIVP